MGLIQEGDRRPRDWAYKVAFDRKDLPSLQEMARHIRDTHDTDMIEDFNQKCERKLAGQETVLVNDIELEEVTKTEDLVVNVGLQQCINIILGTSSVRWTRFGFSRNTGTSLPQITDTALNSSVTSPQYVYLDTLGWNEPKGMKLFYGTITPQDVSDSGFNFSRVDEMGISNPNNVLLNREVFFRNPLSRGISVDGQMFKQVFMFSCVIEFCPVA